MSELRNEDHTTTRAVDPDPVRVDDPHDRAAMRRVTVSGAAGLFMETYDFGIYGLVAAYLSVAFFDNDDATTSLLITWAVFAIPFFIRPIGGLVLGAAAWILQARPTSDISSS